MKTTDYRRLHLLMNAELLTAYDSVLEKLAFVLSIREALDGKDDLDDDHRFSDETYELQDELFIKYSRALSKVKSGSKKLDNLCLASGVLPVNLLNDIHFLLSMKEESQSVNNDLFYPYEVGKNDLLVSTPEFKTRLLYCMRVMAWLNDIDIGIQDYGVSVYLVPESDSEKDINIIDGLWDMKEEDVGKELSLMLEANDNDTDHQQQDKESWRRLIDELNKIKEERKNDPKQ